jgi:hypothetical protein
MQSLIQKEGKAHNEDTAKANRKIPLPEKTYKALEKKAKAEGKTSDQKAAEIVEKKAKSPFPTDAEINPYGFLHFKKQWLDYLGWQIVKGEKGCPLKITENADGSITLRKA